MTTLKNFVETEKQNRQDKQEAEERSLNDLIKALALAPEAIESGSGDQYLGSNGIKLRHEIKKQTILLKFHSGSKIHTLVIICSIAGYNVNGEDINMRDRAQLQDCLQIITDWYLDLVEKYS